MNTQGGDGTSAANRPGRKDLQDLKGLSRSPGHSLVRKLAQPKRPRQGTNTAPPGYPTLASFSNGQSWRWLLSYLKFRFGRRHKFQTYEGASGIYPLGDENEEIRLALAGDWGTGTDEAEMVAAEMKKLCPHYTVHLGDVYYMGDAGEVMENFLGHANPHNHFKPTEWPRGSRGSFSLLGNHEMYASGIAYFKRILPWLGPMAGGAPQGQKASFFCLENEFWRIVGLDTGYNSVGWPLLETIVPPDCGLPPALVAWLGGILAKDDGKGIILLSHHQAFSAFDDWYPKAAAQMAGWLKRPVLWLWGHEHRMTIYDEFTMTGGTKIFARCVGHGGMPVDIAPETPVHKQCKVLFTDRRRYHNDETGLHVGMNGFVRFTFKGRELHLDYVDLHGETIYAEDWSAQPGRLLRNAGG